MLALTSIFLHFAVELLMRMLLQNFLGILFVSAFARADGIQEETIISRVVTIQPIVILDDNGGNRPFVEEHLFEGSTEKIWAQAGIDVCFLPLVEIQSTRFQRIEDAAEATALFTGHGNGQHADSTIINLWVAAEVVGAFGRARTGFNGIVVDQSVFTFNDGAGRLDTIAHELGHNLGLDHFSWGSGGPENLMTAEGRRIPSSVCDIFPDGINADQLTVTQLAVSRSSEFTKKTPERLRAPAEEARLILDGAMLAVENTDLGFCYELQKTSDLSRMSAWSRVEARPGTGKPMKWEVGTSPGFYRLKLQ